MAPQFTYDISGKPIGVFMPIEDWNKIKSKYFELENNDLPEWQKEILDKRMQSLAENPGATTSLDEFLKEMLEEF